MERECSQALCECNLPPRLLHGHLMLRDPLLIAVIFEAPGRLEASACLEFRHLRTSRHRPVRFEMLLLHVAGGDLPPPPFFLPCAHQALFLVFTLPCYASLSSESRGPSTAWLPCTRRLAITAPFPAMHSLKPRLSPTDRHAVLSCPPGLGDHQLPGFHAREGFPLLPLLLLCALSSLVSLPLFAMLRVAVIQELGAINCLADTRRTEKYTVRGTVLRWPSSSWRARCTS